MSFKKQLRLSGNAEEADLRVKLQLELKVENLLKAEKIINSSVNKLVSFSNEFRNVKAKLADLPERKSSIEDVKKYNKFFIFNNIIIVN